jgi:hypothetical protein
MLQLSSFSCSLLRTLYLVVLTSLSYSHLHNPAQICPCTLPCPRVCLRIQHIFKHYLIRNPLSTILIEPLTSHAYSQHARSSLVHKRGLVYSALCIRIPSICTLDPGSNASECINTINSSKTLLCPHELIQEPQSCSKRAALRVHIFSVRHRTRAALVGLSDEATPTFKTSVLSKALNGCLEHVGRAFVKSGTEFDVRHC